MAALNLPMEKVKALFDEPVLSENTLLLYFTDDRDPTASEPDVTIIGIPEGWVFYWWNTSTKEWFVNQVNAENEMVWAKMVDDSNILSVLSEKHWEINTSRSYSAFVSPSFDTDYKPSETSDTFVLASIEISSTLILPAEVSVQINEGSGYFEIARISVSGLVSTQAQTISFIVPTNSEYKIVSVSGLSNSILTLSEISL